jgi:hypothetical protein
MRFIKLELAGAPAVELPLHRRMTVVGAAGDAERLRLAEALSGRARDGVVWAFDDEDPSEEQVPVGDFGIFGLSPDVQAAMLLRAHDIRVAAAQPSQPAPASGEADAQAEAQSAARAELEHRRAQLVARPAPEADTAAETAVATALTELRAAEESARAAADDARRIGAEWDEVATSLAAKPPPGDEDLAAVDSARAALAERREELASARLEVGRGPVSPEHAARIGELHTEVTTAQARVDRPFPGSAARRRLAEAEAAEEKFLQELGFSSYSAYLLDAVVRPVDPESLRRLSNAERAVAEAEAAWQNVAPIADELHAHQSLLRQATRLREEAVALLGFDPGDAIAERLAEWPECCARITETRAELRRVLGAAGVAPDPAAIAETWLAARRAEASEHAAIEAELADIEAELAALERAAADHAARAEAQQAAAEAAHNSEGESLEAYLSARLAVHRHVGPIGSLPIILEDTFADLDPAARVGGLTRLAEMSATVQVIYLTTDPEVVAWAATMPSDQVEVQRCAPIVASISVPPAAVPAPPADEDHHAAVPATPAPAPEPYAPPAPTPAPPPPPYVPPAPTPPPYVPPAPVPPPSVTPLPAAPVAPVADAGTPTPGPRCMECHQDLAVGECHQCRASFCGDHLVRMKRNSRPPLCLSCALVAAGARKGRR